MPPLAMRPHQKPLPKSLTTFLSKKNSAKMLRIILYGPPDQSHSIQLKTVLNTYVLGHFPETKQNEYLNTWFLSFLPACLKEFALLHTSNKIILNDRRAKFQNISNECSFCKRFPSTIQIPVETFSHLYFECPFSKKIADEYFYNLFDFEIDIRQVSTRGSVLPYPDNIVLNIEAILYCYFIYSCRANKKLPTKNNFLMSTFSLKKAMLRASKKYESFYDQFSSKRGLNVRVLNNTWLTWV